VWRCELDFTGSGLRSITDCCERGDEHSGSDKYIDRQIDTTLFCRNEPGCRYDVVAANAFSFFILRVINKLSAKVHELRR
jgi:hypothetical protein